jgi:hypothetical protein
MMNFLVKLALVGLIFSSGVKASDEIIDVELSGSLNLGWKQRLNVSSEERLQTILSAEIQAVYKLPKTTHGIMDPNTLFSFSSQGVSKRYQEVKMGEYKLIDSKNFSSTPYLVTGDLHECVGVAILLEKRRAGMMHVDFKSFDTGVFTKFMAFFPEAQRGQCRVKLLSSVSSVLLADIYKALTTSGFVIESADIPPVFLDCKDRSVKCAVKHYSFEKACLMAEDITRVKMIQARDGDPAAILELRRFSAKVPELNECPRSMILSVSDGSSHQIFDKGHFSSNGKCFSFLNKHFEDVARIPGAPEKKMVILRGLIERYMRTAFKCRDDYREECK